MGFFYLATLYCSQKYWTTTASGRRSLFLGFAWLACLLGMACKEVMVTAPVVVLLYERTLLRGSFREALRASWPLYLGFFPAWCLLLALNLSGPRSASAGFAVNLPAYVWWFTQAKVLLMYLKLACWPAPLSIHHEMPFITDVIDAGPYLLVVTILALFAVILCWRRSAVGFAMAWILIILSPTLVVPIATETVAERRMYLPLAALAAIFVTSVYALVNGMAQRWLKNPGHIPATATMAAIALLTTILCTVSVNRLKAFQDPQVLWQSALDLYPESMTISTNLASVLLSAGHLEESIAVSRQAIAHGVADYATHNNLGAALLRLGDRTGYAPGQLDEAIAELRIATALNPDLEDAFVNLALALLKAGQPDAAIAECHAALAINSRSDRALYGIGTILMSLRKPAEARQFIERALAQNPDSAEAHYTYGLILLRAKRGARRRHSFRGRLAHRSASGRSAIRTGWHVCASWRLARRGDMLRGRDRFAASLSAGVEQSWRGANESRRDRQRHPEIRRGAAAGFQLRRRGREFATRAGRKARRQRRKQVICALLARQTKNTRLSLAKESTCPARRSVSFLEPAILLRQINFSPSSLTVLCRPLA